MKVLTACAGLAISAAMALPAAGQQPTTEAQDTQQHTGQAQRETGANGQAMSDQQLSEADAAAEEMVGAVYILDPVNLSMPGEVIQRLEEMGYTDIQDFDVEVGHYEVEAMSPDGDEVEIEVDPVTGAITDIEENWF